MLDRHAATSAPGFSVLLLPAAATAAATISLEPMLRVSADYRLPDAGPRRRGPEEMRGAAAAAAAAAVPFRIAAPALTAASTDGKQSAWERR